jgi:kanamycin nucleotidyltransferase
VDICSAGLVLKRATAVKGRWALTHGSYKSILSLFDPEGFLPCLGQAVEAASTEDFRLAVNEVLVGEMYEFVGKLRNINLNGPHSYLPYLAMQFAQYGAMLIGLHNRKTYSTGPMVLPEALELPDRPAGFDAVARMVMSGELADPAGIISACETFWQGIAAWAVEYGYSIDSATIPF